MSECVTHPCREELHLFEYFLSTLPNSASPSLTTLVPRIQEMTPGLLLFELENGITSLTCAAPTAFNTLAYIYRLCQLSLTFL